MDRHEIEMKRFMFSFNQPYETNVEVGPEADHMLLVLLQLSR